MLNLGSLNPQQREAVETVNGPVLILAGAGTGKTRVITHRIAHMIGRGIAPGNILAVTFTNKAAREMLERVNQLIPKRRDADGEKPDRPTLCTFHSLCVRILRQHIEKLGYKRNFVIYSESDQLGAIKKVLSRFASGKVKADPGAILGLISRFKNAGPDAASFADADLRAMAEHVQRHYDSALRACNAVDFDDLILLTLRLFREFPDALEACRRRYRYVMVDEYQDTNGAQFQLVHALTSAHRNLCVVGDDDQSIYGWRGAEIANLLDMEKHFPEVKVIKLEQNYRSTNTILHAANAVIKNNARRRGKQLWSAKGQGNKITLHAFTDDEEEARVVVEEIEFKRMARRVPWGDQAILFRTNQQSRPLEAALRKAGVRYHLIGGQSYFDRREVKDFIAYLKVFLNPHDDISLLRIANTPARGLSDVTMERLLAASQERHCSVFTAMRHTDVQGSFAARTRESIQEFVQLVEQQRRWLENAAEHPSPALRAPSPLVGRGEREGTNFAALLSSPSPFAQRGERDGVRGAGCSLAQWAGQFLTEIGYFNEIRRSEKNPEVAESRIMNLKDLMAMLDNASGPMDKPVERLSSFLDDLSLDAERAEDKEHAGDAVTLITMHSCKGLEYPHVFIVGLEEGLLPHSRSKVEGTLDEERRLFYVAITRAQETLTISHCGGRKRYGQLLPCHPSRFLKELPAELVESAEEHNTPVSTSEGKDLFAAMRAALG